MDKSPESQPKDSSLTVPVNQTPQIQPPAPTEPPSPNKRTLWQTRRGQIVVTAIAVIAVACIVAAAVFAARQLKKPVVSVTATPQAQASPSATPNANVWSTTINPTAIPLGDGKVSTSPKVGYVDSCTTSFRGGGAQHAGSWLNTSAGTWNAQDKPSVQGSVGWPTGAYSATVSASGRVISTNDLPVGYDTGTFPIASTDPAYQYDRNPNHIAAQPTTFTLPLNPVAAASPSCTGLGPIGVMTDGVFLYNALDDGGRDAGAHEIQDSCSGHPDGNDRYHYHSVSACLLKASTASSTLVGYAADGYGIYVERDKNGNLPTDADLDVCHGRTSPVMWNGKLTTIYHYDATLEYPYTVGCYHGTPLRIQ